MVGKMLQSVSFRCSADRQCGDSEVLTTAGRFAMDSAKEVEVAYGGLVIRKLQKALVWLGKADEGRGKVEGEGGGEGEG